MFYHFLLVGRSRKGLLYTPFLSPDTDRELELGPVVDVRVPESTVERPGRRQAGPDHLPRSRGRTVPVEVDLSVDDEFEFTPSNTSFVRWWT